MTGFGVLLIAAYFLVVLALTKPLGLFMARLFQGQKTFLHPVLRPLERLVYRLGGVNEESEQHWTAYAGAVLALSAFCFASTYLIQRFQAWLPFNPMHFGARGAPAGAIAVTPDLAFNTAVSFLTIMIAAAQKEEWCTIARIRGHHHASCQDPFDRSARTAEAA